MLVVKQGAVYNSSTPPSPVLTPGMSHEITPFWKSTGVEWGESGCSFKNKYKTQDPRGFSHNALQSITHSDMRHCHRGCGWGSPLKNYQCHGNMQKRKWELTMDIHNADWLKITTNQLSSGHKQGKCQKNRHVCVCECRHAHAYVNVTHNASMRTHTSTHLNNLCLLLGQWIRIKLQSVCICGHVDGGWILGFKMQGNYGS